MKKSIAILGLTLALGTAAAEVGGKFYGVWWDGSQEHFVMLDPVAGTHTSMAVVPGVQWIDATFRVFDPDSGLFGFIGGSANAMSYRIVDAATGSVIHTLPRNDNLKNPMYDPGTGLVYGTWWSDSSDVAAGPHDTVTTSGPMGLRGTEYFAAINPRTGTRSDTPIPGVLAVAASSQFLDTDSGRYVFHGRDTAGADSYYVIDVATGQLIAKIPVSIRLDFPVYNSALGAVHGLWWSDSSAAAGPIDSGSFPLPPQIHGAEYFVTVLDDSTTTMVELPGVKYIANFNRTLDTDSGRYVFTGREASGGIRYYVIDVATGAILSNTPAPGRSVDHIVYAPLASSSYLSKATPIRRAAEPATRAWTLREVPGAVEIAFANEDGTPHAFTLLDVAGKTVMRRDGIRSNTVRVETSGLHSLKAGVYFFRIAGPAGPAGSGKLVIE